jgi:hypothetical protein
MAFSTADMSARASSVTMVSMSASGSTLPFVHHVLVVEAAHHVDDGVGLADVGQELVAQAFTLGGPGDQAGDVDELDDGGLHLLRLDDLGEGVEARVGHFDDAHVGLDGAEGSSRRRCRPW